MLAEYREVLSPKTISNCLAKFDNPLSIKDIQESINHFAYGLRKYPDKSFYNRKRRIATLLDSFKNNKKFIEPNYLSKQDAKIFTIYKNARDNYERNENKNKSYNDWFKKGEKDRRAYYTKKIASNRILDDHTFNEMSIDEFSDKVWPQMCKDYINSIIDDTSLSERFDKIYNEELVNL